MNQTFDILDGLNRTHLEGREEQVCFYWAHLFPTDELSRQFRTALPKVVAVALGVAYLTMAVAFFMYDRHVRKRNEKVVNAAMRSDRIVSSLFPETVRDRLLAGAEEAEKREHREQQQLSHGIQTRLKKFLTDGEDATTTAALEETETDEDKYGSRPIADLFPDTSILFADISGFTAWSSAREPSQVFTLLETVFSSFDV